MAGRGLGVSRLSLGELRRALARRRVLLSAGLAAAAVAAGLSAVAPTPAATAGVVTASRDLPPGIALSDEDLALVAIPAALVPAGAVRDATSVVGRLVAGPVRQGEPLTDVRLLGAGLLTEAGQVAVPVRVAEPAAAALVQAGDHIDLLSAAPEGGRSAGVVAAGVQVLAVPDLGDDRGEGALVVVATSGAVAGRLAAAAVTGRLSLVVLPR